jgi:hypothetical protein
VQTREDLAYWTAELSDEQIWSQPDGLPSVAFQLRHIAGSVDRLTTYLRGEQISFEQLEALHREMHHREIHPRPDRSVLLTAVHEALHQSEQVIRALGPARLCEPRTVGRRQLPTTVIGLVVHLAEHTQRHVGELIVTAKLVHAKLAHAKLAHS